MSHTHFTYERDMPHVNESCHTHTHVYVWQVREEVCLVARPMESCHTESRHTHTAYEWVMSHTHMCVYMTGKGGGVFSRASYGVMTPSLTMSQGMNESWLYHWHWVMTLYASYGVMTPSLTMSHDMNESWFYHWQWVMTHTSHGEITVTLV